MTATAGPVRILIVDDEDLARQRLRTLLSRRADFEIVGECATGVEAVKAIRDVAPEIVVLDVQMPELDGFGVICEIGPERMPATVFVTAYDEFAVRAFDVQALDYLVKPFTDERFETMLARARERLVQREFADLASRLARLVDDAHAGDRAAAAREREYVQRLLVSNGARSLVIRTPSIDWVQADDYYAALHVGGRRHLIRETMASLEAKLDPAMFLRVHRSAIVNLERVHSLDRTLDGQLIVVLSDGTKLPVSRSRRDRVERVLGDGAR